MVALVPMVGLQFFAFRELTRERDAVDAAATANQQLELLAHAGALVAPLYAEYVATLGIARAEATGIPRNDIEPTIGVDFVRILDQARAQFDLAEIRLERAVESLGDTSAAAQLDALQSACDELDRMRAAFDGGSVDPADVDRAYTAVVAALESIHAEALAVLSTTAVTVPLRNILGEVEQLLVTLRYGTTELRMFAEAATLGSVAPQAVEMLKTAGAFDGALDRLGSKLTPELRLELDEFMSSQAFVDLERYRPDFIGLVMVAEMEGTPIFGQPDALEAIVGLMLSSFERLRRLQDLADSVLDSAVERSVAIEAQADQRRSRAVGMMAYAAVISLVLLVWVLRSILRPLRQLTRQARQVRDGDLALTPAKPTGPTDVRVVMRTFDDMVSTLRAYDQQLRRLADGDTDLQVSVPGPLGDALQRSVNHLAEVTQRLQQSEAAATMQARTDALTGLANRTMALERLAQMALEARTTGRNGAIVFLDLDGFKSVNDSEGHAEGDHILGEIGRRLRVTYPEYLVARIGGDEFVVLVPDEADRERVVGLAGDLITLISQPCVGTSGRLYTLTASAGVAIVDGKHDPLTSIAQADSAVYHAKELGRSRVEVFDSKLAHEIEDRAEMALTMRQGLAAGQFFLALQPIIDVATGHPVGAEALLRWRRPGFGEILPNDFIPIAERTDVIMDLERWVLEQAVGILRDWRIDPATAHLRLAVNISGRHIIDGRLASLLDALCRRAMIDPSLLDLEITETHLVADVARAGAVVDDLRQQGVHVAIDDFGTGYSSMGYLHRLTVDTLKIDRVFVAGMCDDRLDRSIVELLLRLGDSLGMHVVAEGVDSQEKLDALREMGCHLAQGFHIARPMPVADATTWLRDRSIAVTNS